MSGFNGRIGFEGDTDRCRQLLGTAIKHANVQRQNKNILGQTSSIKSYDLGGGAYCVVVDLAHMRAMNIVAPVFTSYDYEFEEIALRGDQGPGVFDVLAGYTHDPTITTIPISNGKGGVIPTDVITHFFPTKRTAKRYPDLHRRKRLAVLENSIFAPVVAAGDKPIRWTEHAHIKPTNYSGLMREVVQVVLGLGKVIRPVAEEMGIYPPLPPVGTDYITKAARVMVSAFGLYGHHEGAFVPRVDFDYRFAKTHGVTFDSDGIPWVIEIGMRGVHAMRLYMDPVSMTKEGMARYIQVSPELKPFLLKYGGIPLGLTLPTFELFDKFKRAGEVVELISQSAMQTFYSKSPMSNDTGWCFSSSVFGSEAHNTCWEWGIDSLKHGYHYAISIKLLHEVFKPWTPKRSELARKFSTIYEVNKCRRMLEPDAAYILSVYARSAVEGAKAFDNFVVKPTLDGQAGMSLQRTGLLYHPAKFAFQPQIKFPEMLVEGNLSFDFSDAGDEGGFRVFHRARCDTPMYVCFIEDKLEVISYAFDNTQPDAQVGASFDTTRQDCQWTGEWTDIYVAGGTMTMQGFFYSSRWDFRYEQLISETTITHNFGNKLGAYPMWRQIHPFATQINAWTEVSVFTESESMTLKRAPTMDLSVAIPLHDRNAYYFATLKLIPNRSITHSGHSDTLVAKVTDEYSIYDFVFAWVGAPTCPQQDWIDPAPLDCLARKRCSYTDDTACFDDYEHGGFYMSACKPKGWVESPPWNRPILPSSYDHVLPDDDGEANGDVYFVNDTPYGETITKSLRETYTHGSSLSDWWWRASPDDSGSIPAIKAVHSCLGLQVTNMMDEYNGVIKHLGEPEYMFDIWNACYTGVIE